jgi:hypothetical protein
MDENKKCTKINCIMKYRFEVLGLALIVLATILTVISMDSLGIIVMFVVGALLCCHQYCLKDRVCGEKKEMNYQPNKPHRPRRKSQKPAPKPGEASEVKED